MLKIIRAIRIPDPALTLIDHIPTTHYITHDIPQYLLPGICLADLTDTDIFQ